MNKEVVHSKAYRWHRFTRKGYAAFASLHKVVCIGVLSASVLAVASKAQAQTDSNVASSIDASAQGTSSSMDGLEGTSLDEVTVSASMAPLTGLQSARIVAVVTRQDIEQAAAATVNDVLKLVTGVDVRQRGGFGIQTDISIDGGTFDQVTLLLNGIDIGNPQPGHLSADFPVSIADIERIEVLQGAASRVYGGQSFGGAINIVTKHDVGKSIELAASGGSFGTAEGEARLTLTTGKVSNRISGGGGRSDGGTQNSSWRKGQLYYQGDFENHALRLDWQFGFSRKSYGANTFYSAAYPDQYERNQRLMTSVGAETKGRFHFTPQVFWTRSWDNFELVHNSTFGENFHRSDVYGVKVGGYADWLLGKTAVSALMRHEDILSTNLGRTAQPEGSFYAWSDERNTISFSLEHNILLEHWTVSAGLMASRTSAIDHCFHLYPGVDIAWRPSTKLKLAFSYNKGYRLPTFTEIYYKSPTHEGNRDLKAEHNHSLSLGAEYSGQGFYVMAKTFYHHGMQMIDWVMYTPDDIYHTAAFGLDNVGAQVKAELSFPKLFGRDTWLQRFSAGYTYMHQWKHDAEGVVKSNVAMEYLRHKVVLGISHRIVSHLSMSWNLRWQEREGSYLSGGKLMPYHPYFMLDAKMKWEARRYQLYVQATNLTDHRYYDLGSVPQPGLWVTAGARLRLSL